MFGRSLLAVLMLFVVASMPLCAQGTKDGKDVVHAGNGALDALAAAFNISIHSDQYVPGKTEAIEFLRRIRDDLQRDYPDPDPQIAPRADPSDGALIAFEAFIATAFPNCLAGKGTAWHPSGRFLFIASDGGNSGNVCALDFGADGKTLSAVPGSPFLTAPGARSVAMHPSGNYLYTANFDSNTVSGFAIAGNGVLTPLPGSPYAAGAAPRVIVADPRGRFLYVTNSVQGGTVTGFVIDAATGALTPMAGSPFAAPGFARAIAIDPRGAYVYVSGASSQGYAVNAANGALTPVGAGFSPAASSMTFEPTGRFLYATAAGDNRVMAYRLAGNGIVTAAGPGVPTGDNPISVAVSRTGRYVYTANLLSGTISGFVIDDSTGALSPIAGSPFAAGENVYDLATTGSLWAAETWPAGAPVVRPIGVWGGRPPYTFAVASGALPPGITLDTTLGHLAGKATTAGTYPVAIHVADSAGGAAMQTFTLSVAGNVTLPALGTVVEFYNAALDHYFITWVGEEIAKLDAGIAIKGWVRTGKTFSTWISVQQGASPICRFYIPPGLGDSHFFGRGTAECAATGAKNPSFTLEDAAFMYMTLPVAGTCPSGMTNVYRVFSNRADANHRYTTDRSVRDEMVTRGWLAEGDGPDLVVMCAP